MQTELGEHERVNLDVVRFVKKAADDLHAQLLEATGDSGSAEFDVQAFEAATRAAAEEVLEPRTKFEGWSSFASDLIGDPFSPKSIEHSMSANSGIGVRYSK